MKSLGLFILFTLSVVMVLGQTPSAPQNFSVQDGVYGGALLQWEVASGASAYNVYKSSDGVNYTKAASIENLEYNDWYTLPGVMYHYFVTASASGTESNASDTAAFAIGHHHFPYPGQGIIGGKVIDQSTGEPIPYAVVRFFQPGKLWVEETHTDSAGIYWAALDTGGYLVRADKYHYYGEWYNETYHADSASIVYSIEDTFAIANFSLVPLPTPVKVTVCGTVIDSSTGLPLKNTLIAFIRPHRWLRELERLTGIFGGSPSERFDIAGLGRLHGVVWLGLTDEDGKYSAYVPADTKLIAFAFKPGYIPMFYDREFTPFNADRLQFTADTSGIDFDMISNPLAVNSISGTVADSAGTPVSSYVVLFRKTVVGRIPVRCGMTDSLGAFSFSSLVDGIFFVKAVPVDGYAPAWYSTSDCGVRNWHYADSIVVTSDVSGIDVCVKLAPHLGFGRIAGTVTGEQGNLFALTPQQGVTVYALNNSGEISGYDITEDDGSYSIENLPAGDYTVVADMEGFAQTTNSNISVDETNDYEQTGVLLSLSSEMTSVPGQTSLPKEYKLYPNYPNPFNPVTKIKFDLPQNSQVSVKVYNIVGQRVAILLDGPMDAGTHDITWDASEVGSGIYFVKLVAAQSGEAGSPYSEVRKMILMK